MPTEARQPRKGTLLPDGPKVAQLRVARGWDQFSLASRSGISKRTIERIEHSRPTILKNISFVATALAVDVTHILLGDAKPTVSEESKVMATVPLELVIDREFETYTEEEKMKLIDAVGKLLGLNGSVKITAIRKGSVKVTVEVDAEKADELMAAAVGRKLSAVGVVGLGVPEGLGRLLRGVEVKATETEVVITGVVSSYYLKQMAQETVRPIVEGRRLRNQVEVRPAK